MTISDLAKELKKYLPSEEIAEIKKAYRFAAIAHVGQSRNTGEPYIEHPLAVAHFLADLRMGRTCLVAALLHDLLEDTAVTLPDIKREFGETVANLVEGVTKLSSVRFKGDESEREIETLRKMFLAMAADLRVVVIKLADRLHNMLTLEGLDKAKRERFARETLEVFAPLADRLGIWQFKWRLEDLAFQWLYPKEFKWVTSTLSAAQEAREKYVAKVKKYLIRVLNQKGIGAEISGRAKHLYSLYKKLIKYDRDISKIYDLIAVRIVVDTIEQCYQILGIVHSFWPPLTHRIKDFIAVPKPNGYRSLHTTVFCIDGQLTEIQIRTHEMDKEAKFGVAAHWTYSEQKGKDNWKNEKASFAPTKSLAWINQLQSLQEEMVSSGELQENLKIDVFQDRIFVFTPKGTVKDLPRGATPIDFAFSVHSEVGNHCIGAKVNAKIVPLDYQLANGDVVEILVSKNSTPSRDWLKYAKTGHARNKIRSYFKEQDRDKNLSIGRQILDSEIKKVGKSGIDVIHKEKAKKFLEEVGLGTMDNLFVAIGEGALTVGHAIRGLFTKEEIFGPVKKEKTKIASNEPEKVVIAGSPGILVNFAACCSPRWPNPIIAYITRGRGATIHRKDCPSLTFMDRQRLVRANWEGMTEEVFPTPIIIRTYDRVGMISDISGALSKMGINIIDFQAKFYKDTGEMNYNLVVEISGVEQFEEMISRLSAIPDVIGVIKKSS